MSTHSPFGLPFRICFRITWLTPTLIFQYWVLMDLQSRLHKAVCVVSILTSLQTEWDISLLSGSREKKNHCTAFINLLPVFLTCYAVYEKVSLPLAFEKLDSASQRSSSNIWSWILTVRLRTESVSRKNKKIQVSFYISASCTSIFIYFYPFPFITLCHYPFFSPYICSTANEAVSKNKKHSLEHTGKTKNISEKKKLLVRAFCKAMITFNAGGLLGGPCMINPPLNYWTCVFLLFVQPVTFARVPVSMTTLINVSPESLDVPDITASVRDHAEAHFPPFCLFQTRKRTTSRSFIVFKP